MQLQTEVEGLSGLKVVLQPDYVPVLSDLVHLDQVPHVLDLGGRHVLLLDYFDGDVLLALLVQTGDEH